jgi:hypothetical protein
VVRYGERLRGHRSERRLLPNRPAGARNRPAAAGAPQHAVQRFSTWTPRGTYTSTPELRQGGCQGRRICLHPGGRPGPGSWPTDLGCSRSAVARSVKTTPCASSSGSSLRLHAARFQHHLPAVLFAHQGASKARALPANWPGISAGSRKSPARRPRRSVRRQASSRWWAWAGFEGLPGPRKRYGRVENRLQAGIIGG